MTRRLPRPETLGSFIVLPDDEDLGQPQDEDHLEPPQLGTADICCALRAVADELARFATRLEALEAVVLRGQCRWRFDDEDGDA